MSEPNVVALDGWALVLGASSGMGAATAVELARAGCHIVGVHLDRRITISAMRSIADRIRSLGREAWTYNVNAADETRRDSVLDDVQARWRSVASTQAVRVVVHSLAFGSLLPLIDDDPLAATSLLQLEMTHRVMAHSLVTWVQSLFKRKMFARDARVFAMTSSGSQLVWPAYGAVSSAKAALESYVRQLAMELAPHQVCVNAICAGVTDTPALRRIPSHEEMTRVAIRKNPHHRLTTPEDVARAVVALAHPGTYWMTGNVIRVDGGEGAAG